MRLYPNIEKAMEVNPDRKPVIETQMLFTVNTDNYPATFVAKPSPNIMPCIPLDLFGMANRGRLRIICAVYGLLILSLISLKFDHHRTEF